jgi:trehalose 6-phosphate phosphatase
MHLDSALHPTFGEHSLPGPDDLASTALLLDVDGTILDMAVTPGSVVVSDSLLRTLKELHAKCDGALALVSGRLISDLDGLFAPLQLPAIGAHGAEMRLSAETAPQARHPDAIGQALREQVAAAVASEPRVILEDKRTSLAVHYRLAPQVEHTLKAKIGAIVARVAADDLEIMHSKAALEIKSAHFSKGSAVRELMTNAPFLYRRPVFVGDDTTDESVFEVLPELGGLGYAVERPMRGASGMFGSPREVRDWLAKLCRFG